MLGKNPGASNDQDVCSSLLQLRPVLPNSLVAAVNTLRCHWRALLYVGRIAAATVEYVVGRNVHKQRCRIRRIRPARWLTALMIQHDRPVPQVRSSACIHSGVSRCVDDYVGGVLGETLLRTWWKLVRSHSDLAKSNGASSGRRGA